MPLLNTTIRRFGFEASDKYQHFWDKEDAATAAILQYIFLDLGLEFCLVWQIQHSKQLVYRAEETTYMGSG